MKMAITKGILNILYLGGIVFLVIYILGNTKCSREKMDPGIIQVDKAAWDSLIVLANEPPDTVINYDTIRPEPVVKWRTKKIPVYVPAGDSETLRYYQDSIINDELAIYINDTIMGTLCSREIGYELFVPEEVIKKEVVEKKVPVPVNVPVPRHGFYFGGGLGAGKNGFKVQGNLDYLGKKDQIYGLQAEYVFLGDISGTFLSARIGIKF